MGRLRLTTASPNSSVYAPLSSSVRHVSSLTTRRNVAATKSSAATSLPTSSLGDKIYWSERSLLKLLDDEMTSDETSGDEKGRRNHLSGSWKFGQFPTMRWSRFDASSLSYSLRNNFFAEKVKPKCKINFCGYVVWSMVPTKLLRCHASQDTCE